jgi:hypothetical protein
MVNPAKMRIYRLNLPTVSSFVMTSSDFRRNGPTATAIIKMVRGQAMRVTGKNSGRYSGLRVIKEALTWPSRLETSLARPAAEKRV